jgi:hypothetical protein
MVELTEDEKQRRELHSNYMAEFNRREAASVDNYDKAILGYSTGALALSITFVTSIVKDMTNAAHPLCLKLSWIAWIVALVLIIGSFQVSIPSGRSDADKATRYYLSRKPEGPDSNILTEPNIWGTILLWLNLGAGIAFVVGAALMMFFVWSNL